MPYHLSVAEHAVKGSKIYKNAAGHTECVEFVRQTTRAPHTTQWKPGIKVLTAAQGAIARGTVIAAFDESGHYPTDALGKHQAQQ